eukprot:gene6370-11807_t
MADSQGKAASKEITAELKAAKEEIKKKEYKEALKHCKNVLKIDKSNYHALVFIGLCAKEMEQFEQSRAAYQKAIDQNVEQLLAWQGLCNLYEAADKEEWKEDLVKTYSKLIQGSKSDMSRWKELLAKVIPLQLSLDMTSEALSNLKDLEGASSEPSMELLGHWQRGLNNLMLKLQKEDITLELQEQIENTFQSALEYSRVLGLDIEEIQEGHLKKLKQCLREIGDKEKSMFVVNRILEKGTALLHDFPTNKYALELVIRIRLEQSPGMFKIRICFEQSLGMFKIRIHLEQSPGMFKIRIRLEQSPGMFKIRICFEQSLGMFKIRIHLEQSPGMFKIRIRLEQSPGMFKIRIRLEQSLGMFKIRIRLEHSPGMFKIRIHLEQSPGMFKIRIRLEQSLGMFKIRIHLEQSPGMFKIRIRLEQSLGMFKIRICFEQSPGMFKIRIHLEQSPGMFKIRICFEQSSGMFKIRFHLEQSPGMFKIRICF